MPVPDHAHVLNSLSCVQAKQTKQLAAHPMLRHLLSISQASISEPGPKDTSPANAAPLAEEGKLAKPANPHSVSCIHLKPPGHKGSSSFYKLMDQLSGLEHFVAADGVFCLTCLVITRISSPRPHNRI